MPDDSVGDSVGGGGGSFVDLSCRGLWGWPSEGKEAAEVEGKGVDGTYGEALVIDLAGF